MVCIVLCCDSADISLRALFDEAMVSLIGKVCVTNEAKNNKLLAFGVNGLG